MPVAVVTGSSRGLGLAVVRRLLADGWTVHGLARGEQPAAPGFTPHVVDVTDPAAVQAAASAITAAGRVDLLVNNAGAASMNALLLTPVAVAERLMRVNYLGSFHCLQAFGKAMVRQRAGRIVNVTTVAVPLSLEGEAAYVASKAAVDALTRVAARELASSGVIVSAVGFGPVDTALTRGVPRAQLDRINARIGLSASPSPEAAADFLLAHARSAASGHVEYLGQVA
ncbi:MAG: SDR family oxidoreductase [Verrucomicrobia bacterium]|nr:SDR family oxidoreductase [Verrucomicrobiota bacterium]